MKSKEYRFSIQIYYEDTDHSGVVYHPNFLKYFERAREMVLGIDNLKRLWEADGLGYAVYKAELTYHDGIAFGETVDIRTVYEPEGDYRVNWHQEAWKENGQKAAVVANFQHVCLNKEKQLQPIPLLAG